MPAKIRGLQSRPPPPLPIIVITPSPPPPCRRLSAISKHQSRSFDWYFKDVITVSLNISAQFCILCFNSIVVWNHIPFSVDGQAIAAHVQANVCALYGRQGETGGGWKVRRKAKFRHKLFLPRRITISAKIIWWWWEKNYGYLCSAQTPP